MPPRMSAGKIAGIKPRRVAQRIASAQCDWLGDGVSANLNNMPQTVEQALELIRENQPDATDRALSLLQNTVYSVSMKVCGHRQDAEDTMQDVLLKSIPHLAKFDNPQALKVWLYKVARNRCMGRQRAAKFSRAKNLRTQCMFCTRSRRNLPKGSRQPERISNWCTDVCKQPG